MNKSSGFSLIEIVVSTGIVGMIAIVATGIFTRFIVIQRYNIAQQALQEDVRFSLELMNRELRTGYGSTFSLIDEQGTALTLRNQNGQCVEYRLKKDSGQIERAEVASGGIDCSDSNFPNSSFAPITSKQTVFRTLRFDIVRAESNTDGQLDRQGIVTIIVDAGSLNIPDVALSLQSTVTSRQVTPFTEQL